MNGNYFLSFFLGGRGHVARAFSVKFKTRNPDNFIHHAISILHLPAHNSRLIKFFFLFLELAILNYSSNFKFFHEIHIKYFLQIQANLITTNVFRKKKSLD